MLGSNQDCNFVVYDASDDIVGILKIANPAFNATELEAQDAAADLIAAAEPSLRIAVPLPNLAGEKCTAITGLLDKTAYVRLLQFLPGGTLYESGYLPPAAVAGLGEVAGRVSRALAGFEHPGLDRALQWDLRFGADVVTQLVSHVSDPAQRAKAEEAAAVAWSRIAPLADRLPRQATHLDLTDANLVVTRGVGGAATPDGVIDFGDLSHTWAVSELAITVSSVLGHSGSDPTSILPASQGISRDPAVERRRGRCAVADAGAAHRCADRQRRTTGRPRPRQRLRDRADRRRDPDVRAGHVDPGRRDDRTDQGRPRACR